MTNHLPDYDEEEQLALQNLNFEFERRFFVQELPKELLEEPNPSLIVQGYFLAQDGFALRVRLQADSYNPNLSSGSRTALEMYKEDFNLGMITVKGPRVGGTRYEVEKELDVEMAIELLRRCKDLVIKNRYALWHHSDGWVVDQFLGQNKPLIIAEVERTAPVTDLTIPNFCVTEVTDDFRFSNDNLAKTPFSGWQNAWQLELEQNQTKFLSEFGNNHVE